MRATTFTEVSDGSEGITVLEMLTALIVFTLVILSAVMIFKNSLGRFSRQVSEKEIYSEASRVFGYMEKYLPSAICNNMEGGLRINFKGDNDSLRFVSPFSKGPESDLAIFGIYLDKDASAVKVSVVRVDRAKPDFFFPSGFAGAQILGEGIRVFKIEYFNGSNWLDEWNTEIMTEPCLPELVRVELSVFSKKKVEGERIEKRFTRLIRVR